MWEGLPMMPHMLQLNNVFFKEIERVVRPFVSGLWTRFKDLNLHRVAPKWLSYAACSIVGLRGATLWHSLAHLYTTRGSAAATSEGTTLCFNGSLWLLHHYLLRMPTSLSCKRARCIILHTTLGEWSLVKTVAPLPSLYKDHPVLTAATIKYQLSITGGWILAKHNCNFSTLYPGAQEEEK